ncbi:unnamed protein product [Brachionus calyciflorus]|uniref:Uncharacterized protein n=1 Tax=Brachionus calyciflorus TaxID=104777 RepID=A0A813M8L5_9BILA|nr:unnamed protein product [Brachionus calyciflorus]
MNFFGKKIKFLTFLVILALIPNGFTNEIEGNEEQLNSKSASLSNQKQNDDNLAESELEFVLEQRFRALLPYLYEAFLAEYLPKQDDDYIVESDEVHNEKRSKIKKESPFLKDFRRQQAARWDIGFGKRATNNFKSKSFMDALYGKRSGIKHINPKVSFGRKQQWDIQYGK